MSKKEFSCPRGIDTYTALCTLCDAYEECREATKKRIFAVCGCGGTYNCICGYYEDVCLPIEFIKCPFCGRKIKVEYSWIYLSTRYYTKEVTENGVTYITFDLNKPKNYSTLIEKGYIG